MIKRVKKANGGNGRSSRNSRGGRRGQPSKGKATQLASPKPREPGHSTSVFTSLEIFFFPTFCTLTTFHFVYFF